MPLRSTANAHEYLTFTYGDHMKLPPEDQREAHFKIIEIHRQTVAA